MKQSEHLKTDLIKSNQLCQMGFWVLLELEYVLLSGCNQLHLFSCQLQKKIH